jgi:hypothetical protein
MNQKNNFDEKKTISGNPNALGPLKLNEVISSNPTNLAAQSFEKSKRNFYFNIELHFKIINSSCA